MRENRSIKFHNNMTMAFRTEKLASKTRFGCSCVILKNIDLGGVALIGDHGAAVLGTDKVEG